MLLGVVGSKTCSPLPVQDATVFGCNWLQHDAVDDAQENHGGVQRSQHVGDALLRSDMPTLLPEDEAGQE